MFTAAPFLHPFLDSAFAVLSTDLPFLFFSAIFLLAGAWSASPLAFSNKVNLRFMQRQLTAWGVVREGVATAATPLIVHVTKAVAQLRAWGFFGIGVALLLLASIWNVIATLSADDPEGFVPLSNTIINDFLWLGMFAGFTWSALKAAVALAHADARA